LTLGELEELCKTLFTYPSWLTRYLIEEYQECEFIELKGPDVYPPSDERRLQIHEMPKALYLLRHFLPNVAYLNLAAMRIPLSNGALQGKSPFFEASTLDDLSFQDGPTVFMRTRLARWVAIKIMNSCELIRLITQVNLEQKSAFRERLSGLRRRLRQTAIKAATGDRDIPGMFDTPNWMTNRVLSQVRTLERGFEDIDAVRNLLLAHCERWIQPEAVRFVRSAGDED
jgi:hypothetical protein